MKATALRIERWLSNIETRLVSPRRKVLQVIVHEAVEDKEGVLAELAAAGRTVEDINWSDDMGAAQAKALAEHIAAHPEDAGRTVKDFNWITCEIVQWPRPDPMPAAEISAAEISAAAARNEITKSELEDEFKTIPLNGCKGTDGPSETPAPVDPGRRTHSGPWRPAQRRGNWRTA